MGERPCPAVFCAYFFRSGVLLSVFSIHTLVCAGTLRGFGLMRRHNRDIACGGHPRKGHEVPRKGHEVPRKEHEAL